MIGIILVEDIHHNGKNYKKTTWFELFWENDLRHALDRWPIHQCHISNDFELWIGKPNASLED